MPTEPPEPDTASPVEGAPRAEPGPAGPVRPPGAQAIASSYDAVPYPSYAFAQSHPDTLATMARIFGLDPTPPRRARILELACASGGNLLPMAALYPQAELVGIDLSPRQIDEARQRAQRLGLHNVRFEVRDLSDPTDDLGRFDYVIAHGVFSWVPRPVQERILAIAAEQLTDHGVAYVSYNTHPGWQLHGAVRDLMLYVGRHETTPLAKVARGRSILEWLSHAVPPQQAAYRGMLRSLVNTLEGHNHAYVLHEFFEAHNEPMRFVDFMDRAHGHGLKYLGESGFTPMLDHYFGAEVSRRLREMAGDIFRLEQYMDFLRNRTFRQTLLVPGRAPVDRDLSTFDAAGLAVSSHATTTAGPPDEAGRPGLTLSHEGVQITVHDPMLRAFLAHLVQRWPEAVPFEEAADHALSAGWPPGLPVPTGAQRAEAHRNLGLTALSLASIQLGSLHVTDFPCRRPGDRPTAWPYARAVAATDSRTASARHHSVDLQPFEHQVLRLCDGTRTRAELLGELTARTEAHEAAAGTPHPAAPVTSEALDGALQRLGRAGLMVADAPAPSPAGQETR